MVNIIMKRNMIILYGNGNIGSVLFMIMNGKFYVSFLLLSRYLALKFGKCQQKLAHTDFFKIAITNT